MDNVQDHKGNINHQYEPLSVRMMVNTNREIDHTILMSLYHHRSLTAKQLHQIALPHLHENSLRNRLRTLAERKVLNVHTKAGLEPFPVKLYSLSAFGLLITIEDILDVEEYLPEWDEPKYHYTLDDLRVRAQVKHHYQLQSWLSSLLSKFRPSDILHSEWRRFPMFDDEEAVPYRPDWVIFRKNEQLLLEIEQDVATNPLNIPYTARRSFYKDIVLEPLITIECDMGTMGKGQLIEKWDTYKKSNTPAGSAIALFYPTEGKVNMRRHFNVRKTMYSAFSEEVAGNEIELFEGDERNTVEVVQTYYERDGNLLKGERMTDLLTLKELVKTYNDVRADVNILLVEQSDAVTRELKLPVTPDRIILGDGKKSVLQLVFYAYKGWVNPVIKATSLFNWIDEGNLKMFDETSIVLLYPDESFLEDVPAPIPGVRYVSFNQVNENNVWGAGWERNVSKSRNITWREVRV